MQQIIRRDKNKSECASQLSNSKNDVLNPISNNMGLNTIQVYEAEQEKNQRKFVSNNNPTNPNGSAYNRIKAPPRRDDKIHHNNSQLDRSTDKLNVNQ